MVRSDGFLFGGLGAAQGCLRLTLTICLVLASAGCSSSKYVKVRSVPRSPLVDQLKLTTRAGPQPSDRTMQLLRQYDLVKELKGKPADLLASFQKITDREPTAEKIYSFSELAFLAGKKTEAADPAQALDFYGAAVSYAYVYLFDDRCGPHRNPYDPEFRGACDLYNGSLEGAMRIVKKQGSLLPGCTHCIESTTQSWDVTIVARGGRWRPEDFDRFEFVSDYEVQGLTNQYQTFGLGVPLVAVRKAGDKQEPGERYYPPGLSFPATAFLRVLPDTTPPTPGARARHVALLEIYDPLASTDIVVGRRTVPLESDLSTPLAYYLNDPRLDQLATLGLLRPDKSREVSGLYMLQPYEPGKIPVLMVHGLWSSPITWMEMFNDLRGDPVIRSRFQFWFYLYPTGQPFWESAAQLRQDLATMRTVVDPRHNEPSLDQMVLVGHSMGGLVSKMQTLESGNEFWNIVATKPFDVVKASAEVRADLQGEFFFPANPSVRRLITIGTPHRGSKFANETVRFLAKKIITLPTLTLTAQQQVVRDNPDVFVPDSLVDVKTSLDSLSPESPILPVMLKAPHPPWVKYHNIVGVLPNEGLIGKVAGGTDGVVAFESAHLDDVDSELVVNADHTYVHRHPLSVLEVRRILLEHLRDVESGTSVQTVRRP